VTVVPLAEKQAFNWTREIHLNVAGSTSFIYSGGHFQLGTVVNSETQRTERYFASRLSYESTRASGLTGGSTSGETI
jgi:hypothetical protein